MNLALPSGCAHHPWKLQVLYSVKTLGLGVQRLRLASQHTPPGIWSVSLLHRRKMVSGGRRHDHSCGRGATDEGTSQTSARCLTEKIRYPCGPVWFSVGCPAGTQMTRSGALVAARRAPATGRRVRLRRGHRLQHATCPRWLLLRRLGKDAEVRVRGPLSRREEQLVWRGDEGGRSHGGTAGGGKTGFRIRPHFCEDAAPLCGHDDTRVARFALRGFPQGAHLGKAGGTGETVVVPRQDGTLLRDTHIARRVGAMNHRLDLLAQREWVDTVLHHHAFKDGQRVPPRRSPGAQRRSEHDGGHKAQVIRVGSRGRKLHCDTGSRERQTHVRGEESGHAHDGTRVTQRRVKVVEQVSKASTDRGTDDKGGHEDAASSSC
mmetsp:Transcript_31579/g.84374  ORF Transcript_31579/g.84374 Transcript_31579/m.84374 type:complete len:376 (+) Transcript_31579:136-1263(+)